MTTRRRWDTPTSISRQLDIPPAGMVAGEVGDGPLARFWQGPDPDAPGAWPYDGDWLSDVRKSGAENYNEPWRP